MLFYNFRVSTKRLSVIGIELKTTICGDQQKLLRFRIFWQIYPENLHGFKYSEEFFSDFLQVVFDAE